MLRGGRASRGTTLRRTGGVLALAVLVSLPATVGAQEVVVSAGPAGYDLSGTGTSWFVASRYGRPVGGPFAVEAGVSLFRYQTQATLDDDVSFLFPEVGVTVTAPAGPVAFLLTVGGGVSVPVQGNADSDPTLFAALSMDIPATAGVRFRPSLRVRAVDPWVGTIAEYSLGVRFPLGS